MAKKKAWFKAKSFGWGWGMPLTKEGWLSYGIFLAVWALALGWWFTQNDGTEYSAFSTAVLLAVIVADIGGLLIVSFKYGETPKWRWGKRGRKS